MVTEAAAAVCGQEARDGYIRARVHHREEMSVFTTRSMSSFILVNLKTPFYGFQ